jgi:DNA repair exonuclease SbcCD ATPase subunit
MSKQEDQSMTEIEKAEKTLADLQTKRDNWVKRGTELADERSSVAFAAHTGSDKSARNKLDKLNSEIATHASELASLDSAIAEATQRLAKAKRESAIAQDRAQAQELRDTIKKLAELAAEIDAALADAAAHIGNLQGLLNRIHSLGCASPSHDQLRVLAGAAVKTFLMTLPFQREFEHLAPSARRTFEQIVKSWQTMLEQNIAARLGNKEAA